MRRGRLSSIEECGGVQVIRTDFVERKWDWWEPDRWVGKVRLGGGRVCALNG